MQLNAKELAQLLRSLPVAIYAMREVAQKAGPMHAYWDAIFDAEAVLEKLKSLL